MAKQLSNLPTEGYILGQNATDKLGFFGTTAVVRPTVSANASSSATTIAQLNVLISALGSGANGLGLITAA
ncbi:MAG TPA: hypothetical protein VF501_06660 [Thiobacillus sp.]